jgi:hypothetical protein
MQCKKIFSKDGVSFWDCDGEFYAQFDNGQLVSFYSISPISLEELEGVLNGELDPNKLADSAAHRDPMTLPIARSRYRALGIYEPTVPGTELPEA